MRSHVHFASVLSTFALVAAVSTTACSSTDRGTSDDSSSAAEELRTPGAAATDKRAPELGDDLSVLATSQTSLEDAVRDAESAHGPVIEAKFELGDDGKLSLSLYPAGKDLGTDAERNVFQELSGDPTASPFAGSMETFNDQEHLTRSARDLTLRQLSRVSLLDAAERYEYEGTVFWTIPTIRYGRAGYGVYTARGKKQKYHFVDGGGSRARGVADLGDGPGDGATDARTPELGGNVDIVRSSHISMSDALAQVESAHGPAIEAKFELGDDGKLSLSIYPVSDTTLDAERASFGELSGDPTGDTFAPSYEAFAVPDVEHLTRSARDLTLVQTASLSLRDAVAKAERAVPGGFVFWAIPTIRDTRAGYGVYVYGADKTTHYLFIS